MSFFKTYFEKSSHALCIWDEKRKRIKDINFTLAEKWKNIYKRDLTSYDNLQDFLKSQYSEIKILTLDESYVLLECDHLFLQVENKTEIEELQEQSIHSAAIAEELSSKLERSEEQFQKIASIAPTGMLLTNTDFELLWFNEKVHAFFGSSLSLNENFLDSIYLNDVGEFHEKLAVLREKRSTIEFDFSIINQRKRKKYHISCHVAPFVGFNLEEAFIFILEDCTENVQYVEEIKERNLELTQTNHELDKFIYSVSHNIRGPVSSLRGLLNVIDISDVKTVQQLSEHISKNLDKLETFIEDIQNVSTNIHTHISPKKVEITPILKELIKFLSTIYKVQPLVSWNLETDQCIYTDEARLQIILKYILKNAFQYRNRSRDLKISIKCKKIEDQCYLEIKDNGIGIRKEDVVKVFDMFYRGTEISTGNGMGLHNTRSILKKLGGTINLESQEGKGTVVKIYLPAN